MKRRQLLFWTSCSRATPPTLLICIFVSPWYPKWKHVLWAQETFICILWVSFSSFFSLSLTEPLVFGVSSAYNKEANWIYFCLVQFSGEDTRTSCPWFAQTLRHQFSVSFFPCSSIWQSYQVFGVSSVICGHEELNTFLLLLSSVGHNLEYREHGFQWNIYICGWRVAGSHGHKNMHQLGLRGKCQVGHFI